MLASRMLRAARPLARPLAVRGFASRVITVSDEASYKKLCAQDKLVVTNFTATWCGPCKAAAPIFDKMSEDHGDVVFCKIDIDDEELQEVVVANAISAVPTYTFVKGDEIVADAIKGANMPAIEEVLGDLA
ncbi:thioredoxin domain-containing protein [Aureococcus anophagefferens]|uniref:Thioredoxin domain-containing protein n=2 Tax=Aureococcus anophagefferens TaxID=44056 RepID=A0ABR1FMV1_AURAN|nr:hypothetical protein JL721_2951 [Aureococcus anophagefferens]KAH8097882.1 hypothetical protein JL720_801 [Aureococcus anophagefferens]